MEIRRVGVVGLGTMGAGIAQVSVQSGFETVGREVSDELAERGRATVERYLDRGVEKGRLSQPERDGAVGRLTLTTDLADLASCDLVIEAVLEELDLKRELFAELDRVTRSNAILATNTSALSVSEIAEATERPQRVVGMHFFNPAPAMPLVEVVAGARTSPDVVRSVADLARGMGKTPVLAADMPGFIVNRVARPFYGEAFKILGDGSASVPQIDQAMRAAGFRMGPLIIEVHLGSEVMMNIDSPGIVTAGLCTGNQIWEKCGHTGGGSPGNKRSPRCGNRIDRFHKISFH